MADTKEPTKAAAPIESAGIGTRIAQLQDDLTAIRKELLSFEGKLKNRDPALQTKLKDENTKLKQRLERLEKALFGLLADGLLPRDAADAKTKVEILRLAAVDHCKKTNIDTNLWKKIES